MALTSPHSTISTRPSKIDLIRDEEVVGSDPHGWTAMVGGQSTKSGELC
jgi:sucrose-6-phosphate hydrolase SacC (GH32 family)